MNILMTKLETIAVACDAGPKEMEKKGQDEASLDDFQRLKKKISRDISAVRKALEERDDLEATNPESKAIVELSFNIRKEITRIKEEAEELRTILKKLKSKAKKKKHLDPAIGELLENRSEIVKLTFKHIKECSNLEKKRYHKGATGELFDDDDDEGSGSGGGRPRATVTKLPDIDAPGFEELRMKDQRIDEQLEIVSAIVKNAKEIAVEIGKEADVQSAMIDVLNDKADKNVHNLENLNVRLKTTIDGVRKGDKFILDFILICVLLGIGGFIYSKVA